MKAYEIFFLIYRLAKMGALHGEALLNTKVFGEAVGFSQQTASRKLVELERLGYVRRRISKSGQAITITGKGRRLLEEVYADLSSLLREVGVLCIYGRVFSGFGEGRYYIMLPGYRSQIRDKLGFDPYPGTLNIRLEPESLGARRLLESLNSVLIKGFEHEGRRLGAIKCFRALIAGRVEGGLLLIERTHYGPDVVELVAPVCLRRVLNLCDGDLVEVTVYV